MSNPGARELIEEVTQSINGGNYRHAAEIILQKMKEIAEDNEDKETANDIGSALIKIFDIPNIDWGKAAANETYEIASFIR